MATRRMWKQVLRSYYHLGPLKGILSWKVTIIKDLVKRIICFVNFKDSIVEISSLQFVMLINPN